MEETCAAGIELVNTKLQLLHAARLCSSYKLQGFHYHSCASEIFGHFFSRCTGETVESDGLFRCTSDTFGIRMNDKQVQTTGIKFFLNKSCSKSILPNRVSIKLPP